MIFLRRRLLLWLIKAYLKRWGKFIALFFLIGLLFFFLITAHFSSIIAKLPVDEKENIGIVGSYTIDSIPALVLEDVSRGLTVIDENGTPKPDIAKSWEIKDNGKTYIFYLKENLRFHDGTALTSRTLKFPFSDVLVSYPNDLTILFKLKESYSPFLVTASRPILREGFVGIGAFGVKKLEVNGNFVQSISLASVTAPYRNKAYNFYPSEESLKLAFILGEVTRATGLSDTVYKSISFSSFPTVRIRKAVNYRRLVTLFYNTRDRVLSDEKIRNALSYGLPDTFSSGERNYTPFSPVSWVNIPGREEKQHDAEHAKKLLQASSASKSAELSVKLTTLKKHREGAEEVAASWKEIGVKTDIETVDSIPSSFQIFLGDFTVPKDPDQYTLWHKDQENNITHYSNLRIDKLLEDGRQTLDREQRKKIYADFQKYLLADPPASFLYFPFEYEIKRK